MARVQLQINDPANHLTLRAILQAGGHEIVDTGAEVVICDAVQEALESVRSCPTLLLTTAADIRQAVAAMREGVYGYVMLPFQPGEAEIMVRRAAESTQPGVAEAIVGEGMSPSRENWLDLEEVETRHILETLRLCRNSYTETAKRLGIGRNTLWRKLKRIRGEGGN